MSFGISTVVIASAGTAQAFSTSKAPWKSITVRARPDNSSLVYVGVSTVNSTSGLALNPGEAHVFNAPSGIGIALNAIYADAAVSADAVDYWVYNG